MRTVAIASSLLALGMLSAPAHAELVKSSPQQLTAGSGSTLLLRFLSMGDRDPSTQPMATVDGNNIRIDLNDECVEITCDVVEPYFFRVELPPLEEGDYTATAYLPGSGNERGSFVVNVGPALEAAAVRPADGFWMPVDMPGTGVHLQLRGETLAVSQFDQVQGEPTWRLDAAPLHGDSALLLLRNYSHGSCFGCEPYQAPILAAGGTPALLQFTSARTATAELSDGAVVPLVNMPFGVDYLDVALAPDDEVYGSLTLPDLSGRWAIPGFVSNFMTFDAAEQLDDGTVLFSGTSGNEVGAIRIECVPQDAGQEAGCFLSDTRGSPPRTRVAFAPLGDVGEDEIRFVFAGGTPVWHGVRIPDSGTEDSAQILPAEGFWSIPNQPGTGMHFQHRGEFLAVSQFDFVDDQAHWRLGVAPLTDTGAEVALHSHSGGSCFGCTPHQQPVVDSDPPVAHIVFDSARRATVDLGGDTVIPLVNVPFGVEYVNAQLPGGGDEAFGPLALPDLSGTWAFDHHASVQGANVVTLHGPVIDGTTVRFARDEAEGERFELVCAPGNEVAPAGCDLHVGDAIIGTPPPGWIPFARLGDIEEDRMRFIGGPGGSGDAFRVFYAVRIPAGE